MFKFLPCIRLHSSWVVPSGLTLKSHLIEVPPNYKAHELRVTINKILLILNCWKSVGSIGSKNIFFFFFLSPPCFSSCSSPTGGVFFQAVWFRRSSLVGCYSIGGCNWVIAGSVRAAPSILAWDCFCAVCFCSVLVLSVLVRVVLWGYFQLHSINAVFIFFHFSWGWWMDVVFLCFVLLLHTQVPFVDLQTGELVKPGNYNNKDMNT